MARIQAQAQAQAQHQSTISHVESLELVRCLLRVSIFHISYLRGLFPDSHFKGVDMKNLDSMNIKMLLPQCEESRRLIDWVEDGVYDAIRNGYLKTLFFGIATDPSASNLLEEYIFNFNYGSNGVEMDVQQRMRNGGLKGGMSTADAPKDDLSTVKYQVTRLMRMLVQICQTLDRVPEERFLFMKLMYHDHAPEEYEPPFFVGLEDGGGTGHFSRKPFTMKVGDVGTSHHSVSMKIKSTLDCCDEEGEGDAEGEPEMVASALQPTSGTAQRTGQQDTDITMPDSTDGEALQQQPHQGPALPAGASLTEQQYASIKGYVLTCLETYSQVEMADAHGCFFDIASAHIRAAFQRLQQEGVVVEDAARRDTFHLAAAAVAVGQRKAKATPAGANVARQMANLGVSERQQRAEREQAQRAADASQRGGINTTGSDITGNGSALPAPSAAAKRVTRRMAGEHSSQPPPAGVYFDSQPESQALGKRKARKASYVEDPIHQAQLRESGGAQAPTKRTKHDAGGAAPKGGPASASGAVPRTRARTRK